MTGSQIEELYLANLKSSGKEYVFVMRQGQHYLGSIKKYDDKVIEVEGHASDRCIYPQDILLYRADLSAIYREG